MVWTLLVAIGLGTPSGRLLDVVSGSTWRLLDAVAGDGKEVRKETGTVSKGSGT